MKLSALLLLAAAVPALAGPVRLKGGAKAEEKLRKFVAQDAKLKARLEDAAKREQAFLAEARDSDLRDAVADKSADSVRAELEKAPADKRKAVLETLPGMKPMAGPACVTLADCPAAELSIEVQDAREIPDTIRRAVRPWMVLQQARGSEVRLETADGAGDAAVTMTLKGVEAAPIVFNVSPHLLGGFTVWVDHPYEAAALYERERAAVLNRAP
jgi:hypothetical protein